MQRTSERHRWLAVILALALAGAAPTPVIAQAAAKLKVVASTSDLATLAMEVGGGRIKLESIVRGNQHPHSVPAKPSYLLKLRLAGLLARSPSDARSDSHRNRWLVLRPTLWENQRGVKPLTGSGSVTPQRGNE